MVPFKTRFTKRIKNNWFIKQKKIDVGTTLEIITQISKTGNTPFEFINIKINLDDNLFVSIKAWLLSLESYIDNYNPYSYIIIHGNLVKGTVDKDGNVYG